MAAVQDHIAIEICKDVVQHATAILDAFDGLEAAKEQMDGAEITLSDFDIAIGSNGDIQHATGAVYAGVIDQIAVPIVTYLKATDVSGKSLWNWLQSVRR